MSTGIDWCDETINPIVGCSKVSPACDNCYAEVMARRLQSMGTRGYGNVVNSKGNWTGKLNFIESELLKPEKWKKHKRIFIGSMTDLFHKNVDFRWVSKIIEMVDAHPQHTFMILTKRPERIKEYLNFISPKADLSVIENLWIGTTVENQEQANRRIPILLNIPASKRFVSIEPILSRIELHHILPDEENDSLHYIDAYGGREYQAGGYDDINRLDWVIVGGESGHNARPMHYKWAKALQINCESAGIPFFFKQWGEWVSGLKAPNDYIKGAASYKKDCYHDFGDDFMALKVSTKESGKILDGEHGKLYQEFPDNKY